MILIFKRKLLKVVQLLFLLSLSVTSYAQPGGGGDPGENVPITGIEILLIGGGLFGVRKLLNRDKKNN